MTNAKKRAAAWLLCAVWMGVIFAMSAMPGDASSEQSGRLTQLVMAVLSVLFGARAESISPQTIEFLVRKGAHMAEYAVLFFLYRRALRLSGVRRCGLSALALCAAYAATDEFHQSFVGGRGPSPVDVMIDTVGAAAAWALLAAWEKIKSKRNQKDALP